MGSLRQFKVSSRERAIIIGTLLGDGHLAMLKTGSRLEVNHSETQKEYVFWKRRALRRFVSEQPRRVCIKDARYGKTYVQRRFYTRIHPLFTEMHSLFYDAENVKHVRENILDMLTSPRSLAVWFMDDGGRRNDSYGMFLNTLSFSRKEQEILQTCLQKNFSLETRLHWIQDGYRIYIPASEAKRFSGVIYPYLIPSMQYKLPYNPVTTSFARLDRARDRSR